VTGGLEGDAGVGVLLQQAAQDRLREAGVMQRQQGAFGFHGPESITAPEGAVM